MFNRKLKTEVKALRAEIDDVRERAWAYYIEKNRLTNRCGSLVKALRDMDQLAFSISQCSTIESMRPHIQKLCELVASRQQAESARIRNLMITEIKETYGNGEQPVPAPQDLKRIS